MTDRLPGTLIKAYYLQDYLLIVFEESEATILRFWQPNGLAFSPDESQCSLIRKSTARRLVEQQRLDDLHRHELFEHYTTYGKSVFPLE